MGKGSVASALIADDNRDAADALSVYLQTAGFRTLVAYTGASAALLANEFQPIAVVLDLGMPDLNGFDVAASIRARAWGSHCVIFAVTGWSRPDDRRRSQVVGFDGYFVKPVDPIEVERAILRRLAAQATVKYPSPDTCLPHGMLIR